MKYLLFVFSAILLDTVGCGHRHNEPDFFLNVSPNEIAFDYKQETIGITVSSNLRWTIVTENGSWLEIYPLSGEGDAKINITAQSNESTSDRFSKIIIRGEDMQRNVQVYQKGKDFVDNK